MTYQGGENWQVFDFVFKFLTSASAHAISGRMEGCSRSSRLSTRVQAGGGQRLNHVLHLFSDHVALREFRVLKQIAHQQLGEKMLDQYLVPSKNVLRVGYPALRPPSRRERALLIPNFRTGRYEKPPKSAAGRMGGRRRFQRKTREKRPPK